MEEWSSITHLQIIQISDSMVARTRDILGTRGKQLSKVMKEGKLFDDVK
jgi:hypothetical protein